MELTLSKRRKAGAIIALAIAFLVVVALFLAIRPVPGQTAMWTREISFFDDSKALMVGDTYLASPGSPEVLVGLVME